MVAEGYLPYGRQSIDEEDIKAVVEALQSEWLTTGPGVERFENNVAAYTGSAHAVAVSNGTAALHTAMHALGIGPGDEVIVPPLTFAATANAVLYLGGTPVFADIEPQGLLIDPAAVEWCISPRTRAIVAVDYAGQPCDYEALRRIASGRGLALVADACHSLGGSYRGAAVGTQADLTALSFHPVKPLTTGEGGMVLTDDEKLAERMRCFRNHGITSDHRKRQTQGIWQYEMTELGFNYRLSDIQCALGASQLRKLTAWIERRRQVADLYRQQLIDCPGVQLLHRFEGRSSGWHLLVIRVQNGLRDALFRYLRDRGIGANVHYGLVYQHPYYRNRFPQYDGCCPVAEQAAGEVLSLPIFPAMRDEDVLRVCTAVAAFVANSTLP